VGGSIVVVLFVVVTVVGADGVDIGEGGSCNDSCCHCDDTS
jgi:hypothetical protein